MTIPEHIARWWLTIAHADLNGVEPTLILAIVWKEVEQDGSEWSHRAEEGYQYFYDPERRLAMFDRKRTVEGNRRLARMALGPTEYWDQSSSWGLMQVMGAVAREYGYDGWLPGLCLPSINLQYGSLHLSKKLAQVDGDLREALKRYNGRYEYADDILDRRLPETRSRFAAMV